MAFNISTLSLPNLQNFNLQKIISERIVKFTNSKFANDKEGENYHIQLNSSMDRYQTYRKENLYAIILPSGMGKSTTCKKFGCIDVDDIVFELDVQNRLVDMREKLLLKRDASWVEHNQLWYSSLRRGLDPLVFDKPEIIMVHTEECALEIGAHPLVAVTTDTDMGLKERSQFERALGRLNRMTVKLQTKTVPLFTVDNFYDMQRYVWGCIFQVKEVPAPLQWVRGEYEGPMPAGYSDNTPDWILRGWLIKDGLRIVEGYFKQGMVPAVVVSYYSEIMFGIYGEEGATNMSTMWVKLSSKIASCVRPAQDLPKDIYDREFDFNMLYPYESAT